MVHVIRSPKYESGSRASQWYGYYAGYRSEFVEDVLSTYLRKAEVILDPWNGAGTTTAVASALGREAVGIEINPALAIIARARQTPSVISGSLVPIANEIVIAAARRSQDHCDPIAGRLQNWFCSESSRALSDIRHAILTVLSSECRDLTGERLAVGMPNLATFFMTALFQSTRELLGSRRSSNPTWTRIGNGDENRICVERSTVSVGFVEGVAKLAGRLMIRDDASAMKATIMPSNLSCLDGETRRFDGCLTSPPYCTRIDYVKNSLLELVLTGLSDEEIHDLRKATTGTPLVRGLERKFEDLGSDYALEMLRTVRNHQSHGSQHYYYPWLGNYFAALKHSLGLLTSVVKFGAPIGIVVQDSYYKEHQIDLQRIVIDLMRSQDRALHARHDFNVSHLMSRMNPRARAHAPQRAARESLLLFV